MSARRRAVPAALAAVAGLALPVRGALPVCADQTEVNARCEAWSRFAVDVPRGLVATGNGQRVYVASTGALSGGSQQTLTARAAGDGAPLWSRYATSPAGPTTATAVAVAPDDTRVVVAGAVGTRSFLASYAASSGAVQWTAVVGDPRERTEPVDVAVSPRGDRVFVVALRTYGAFREMAVTAYDARTGRVRWHQRASGAPAGLAVSPGGDRVFVTGGLKRGDKPGAQSVTFAFDTATGRMRWGRATRHGTTNQPVGIAVTGRGDQVVVLGAADVGTTAPAVVYHTVSLAAADGRVRWTAVEAGDVHTSALPRAVVTAGDRVYVTGATGRVVAGAPDAQASMLQFTTAAYDARTGKKVWRTSYAPPAAYPAVATALAAGAGGSMLYVGGFVAPPSGVAAAYGYVTLVAYRQDGTQAWVARSDVRAPESIGFVVPVGVAAPRLGGKVFLAAYYDAPGVPAWNGPDAVKPPAPPEPCDSVAVAPCETRTSGSLLAAYPA